MEMYIDINIDDYKDIEKITIAEYVAARDNVEMISKEFAKNGDLKKAWHYTKIYFELNKLLDKKVKLGSKIGYDYKGHSNR